MFMHWAHSIIKRSLQRTTNNTLYPTKKKSAEKQTIGIFEEFFRVGERIYF
jgi:hypothetical protein